MLRFLLLTWRQFAWCFASVRYITFCCITLHCIAFHSIPFHSTALHYITWGDRQTYISSGMWQICCKIIKALGTVTTLGWFTFHSWKRIWTCQFFSRFLTRSSGQRDKGPASNKNCLKNWLKNSTWVWVEKSFCSLGPGRGYQYSNFKSLSSPILGLLLHYLSQVVAFSGAIVLTHDHNEQPVPVSKQASPPCTDQFHPNLTEPETIRNFEKTRKPKSKTEDHQRSSVAQVKHQQGFRKQLTLLRLVWSAWNSNWIHQAVLLLIKLQLWTIILTHSQ